MSNKFQHIKKKPSPEAFIKGADKTGIKVEQELEHILLSVTSKIKREDAGKEFLLNLRKETEVLLEKHCKGNKVGIINYLVARGLEQLIEDDKIVIV
jgi:hypothetical protein